MVIQHSLAIMVSLLLLSTAGAQTCTVQRIFPSGFSNPLICDGDAGGSQISVFESSIVYRILGLPGPRPVVAGFNVLLPNRLKLFIARGSNNDINRAASFIQIGTRKYTYLSSDTDTRSFRIYFNVLQVLVRQFESGNCPIDNKGQVFTELASVRGVLLSLASSFLVKDCSGGRA